MSASLASSALTKTYATKKNERFSNKNSVFVSISDRWRESLVNLPQVQQKTISVAMQGIVAEFKRRNPNIKTWADINLAEAKTAKLSDISIDITMQRPLNAAWVLNLLSKFSATMVMPIHVYRDASHPGLIAWDGQHTSVLLWLIATQILGCRPEDCEIPVNIYKASGKAAMRINFISLHSDEGKKHLDELDRFEQMVYGVRVDQNNINPIWVAAEEKQKLLEANDLFVTHKKYGDENEPNAISRMPEINSMTPQSLGWLCSYLALASQGQRPIEEKEMRMMGHYFERCRQDNIPVDDAYITDLYLLFRRLFNCDFSPDGPFWAKAGMAYKNWHALQPANGNVHIRFVKEPMHGEPFLLAQMKKSFTHATPRGISNTPFWPAASDLW